MSTTALNLTLLASSPGSLRYLVQPVPTRGPYWRYPGVAASNESNRAGI
jgi:hypothetical protein